MLFLKRLINKLMRIIRGSYFKHYTKTKPKKLHIGGKIYLINPNIKCGDNVLIMPGAQFFGDGPIEIGDNVMIGNNVMVYASKNGGVFIGNDVLIAADCYIIDNNHGIKKGALIRCQEPCVQRITIGNDVWLCNKVTVLKGSQIMDGCVIGAMSLVNGTIQSESIAVGIPAKTIRKRTNE